MRHGSPQCDARYMCDEVVLRTECEVQIYIYVLYDSSLCHMKYMRSKA